ncbi:PAS domain S-box protein [Candidatus Latescibacterota bacterium]
MKIQNIELNKSLNQRDSSAMKSKDITRRKITENNLKENEAKYRHLYEDAPVMMHSIDEQGEIISVSNVWLKKLGYSRSEVIGKKSTDFLTKESRKYAINHVLPKLYKQGYVENISYQFVKKNGEIIDVELSAVIEKSMSGSKHSIVVLTDVTERKIAVKALKESEEKHRTLFETMVLGVVYQDAKGQIISANPAAERILGLSLDQMQGKTSIDPLWKCIHEDGSDFPGETHPVVVALKTGKEINNVVMAVFHPKDKKYHWININAIPQFHPGEKKPYQVNVTFDDISERRNAVEDLIESEQKFKTYIANISDVIVILDKNGIIKYKSPNIERYFGWLPEDLIGTDGWDTVHPDDLDYIQQQFMELLEHEGNTKTVQYRYLCKDKSYKYIELYGVNLVSDPLIQGVLANYRDITAHRESETALRNSENRLRKTQKTAKVGSWEHDISTGQSWGSEEAFRIFGIERKSEYLSITELRKKIIDLERVQSALKDLIENGKEYDIEYEIVRESDGKKVFIHSIGELVYNEHGDKEKVSGYIQDITERKKFEEEQTKASKLESIGILAGGIAHDFNNILAAILGNVSLAKISLDDKKESLELLTEAEKASLRAKDLTQQLLTFSKGGAPVKETTELTELIKDTVKFSLRGSNVGHRFTISRDLWNANVDKGQISQVIGNLAINAQQAMPNGGTVNIKAGNVKISSSDILPLANGNYVKISLKDSGIGIPEEFISKIFDPYFTSKQKGSGLGLATTFSIVNKHDGYIEVESEIGVGTIFHVYIPASFKKVKKKKTKKGKSAFTTRKILVMDDDEMVRNFASKLLKSFGHEVKTSEDGAETIHQYKQAMNSDSPIDIVIMDLTIPGGMGGKEAITKLLEINPEAKVIVSSGYSNDPVVSNYKEYGFKGFISKPYNIAEMEKVLKNI